MVTNGKKEEDEERGERKFEWEAQTGREKRRRRRKCVRFNCEESKVVGLGCLGRTRGDLSHFHPLIAPPPPFFLPPSAPPSIFFALSSFSSVALSLSPSLSMSASKWQSLYQTWKVILVPPGFFKAASYNCTVSRERECRGYTEFKRSLVTLQRCRNLNSDLKRET